MISGVKIINNESIIDERGKIILLTNHKNKFFNKFGEIYCSEIKPGFVKAWRKHKLYNCIFTLIKGKIKMVICKFDKKKNTYKFNEILLSEEKNLIVTVKNNIWYGFKCIGENKSIITNIISGQYEEGEIERLNVKNNYFQYDWSIKNR